MSEARKREPMLDMYLFETSQLLERLEQCILSCERDSEYESSINEIFRIMHTIKGNSAMMLFGNISELAHALEDLFDCLRQARPGKIAFSGIADIVLEGVDFIKGEIAKLEAEKNADGHADSLIGRIRSDLQGIKETNPDVQVAENSKSKKKQRFYVSSKKALEEGLHSYQAVIRFEEGCEMEDLRAFTIVHNLKEIAADIWHNPKELVENSNCIEMIRDSGFAISFSSGSGYEKVKAHLEKEAFIKELFLEQINVVEAAIGTVPETPVQTVPEVQVPVSQASAAPAAATASTTAGMISVSVKKLDELMDLVGELVISEAMVTRNPEISGLSLDSFHKAARQLRKITNELQDNVMSIRMVPLSTTFQKMNRLVRDMGRKVGKEVQLELVGQETEVDKNIIEHIGDPLMHLIRNAMDHGIESAEEREAKGKSRQGKITLEARNMGSDVWIIVRDDGKGLDKEKIYKKAYEHGLTKKAENELTDKEIYGFIFLPGFSTKEAVTEFSGRGVGMDVVQKNIEKVRGTIYVDSTTGSGSSISVKIPLTLTIIDGMTIRVGASRYTIPITDIRESLRIDKEEIIEDLDGNEMVMLRGECHPVTRLHKLYGIANAVTDLRQGIIIILESDGKTLCLFADELLGEQQVVVKTLPNYIKKVRGLAGCTILGDGGISLILDAAGLMN